MKAVVCTKLGSPDGLQLQEVAKPTPGEHEVLIHIFATTVTAADCELRGLKLPLAFRLPMRIYLGRTRPKPLILGQELAGEIEAVGPGVTRFRTGDRVVAWSALALGTYAEYTCLPENTRLAVKPSTIPYEQAAPLAVGGVDAMSLLRKAHIQSGQKVLINGAGGSIGAFAVQIARHLGAEVTAVDSTGKLDMLRSLGADRVIDYTREDFTRGGQTYDVIFDVVGKTSFSRSIRSLTPHGRYIIANTRPFDQVRGPWVSSRSDKQVILWQSRSASEYREDFKFLSALIEAGKVKTVIDRCYPLAQVAEAHRYVDTGQKKGNVAVTVD